MSASLILFFTAEDVFSIRDCRVRLDETSGTRCAFIMGILDRPPAKVIVLWATASIRRCQWVRKGGEGRGVFQLRRRLTDERPLVRNLEPSGALYEEREGKEA